MVDEAVSVNGIHLLYCLTFHAPQQYAVNTRQLGSQKFLHHTEARDVSWLNELHYSGKEMIRLQTKGANKNACITRLI